MCKWGHGPPDLAAPEINETRSEGDTPRVGVVGSVYGLSQLAAYRVGISQGWFANAACGGCRTVTVQIGGPAWEQIAVRA